MVTSDRIWPLAIVGRGSSAAYYLSWIDLTDYGAILAVGEDDPWAGKRGHSGNSTDATLNINQPLHLLAHLSETIPAYSKELVDRLAWARKNEEVLRRCCMEICQATVINISEQPFPPHLTSGSGPGLFGFRIDMKETGKGSSGKQFSVYAYKVVVCAGTGGHRVPDPLAQAREDFPKQVLDLDEFAKLSGRELNSQTRVIVVGANAAIDAVHKALNYGCKIDWLIDLKAPTKPPILATQPLMQKAWDDWEKAHKFPGLRQQMLSRLNVFRYEKYEYRRGPDQSSSSMLMLRVTPNATGQPLQNAMGNYIAYGIGPDGTSTGMIANAIQAKLKPILDSSRALNSDPGKAATVLGYEAEGTGLRTGLEVFGAMSGSIGRDIANSKDRMSVLEKQIEEYRKTYEIFVAIQNADLPTSAFAASPKDLAKKQRGALHAQLQSELRQIVNKNPSQLNLESALEALANQILAYHTAAAYAALGDDPNALKHFRNLLNQVATNLPKGSVGDHGQLTSINAALGAYATMRGHFPKYMPSQQFQMRGPQEKGAKLSFIDVTNTKGDIDFNLDNAQNLAIYVCVSFPNIPPNQANAFVDEVMKKRRASDIGFTDIEANGYRKRLADMEMQALREKARPLAKG
ncbi:MAG: hypothetical protein JO339_25980 [Alphaproteobacteria bacterium]|nr:hypothetical protein [Alphaproteobacteria bacterium]